MSKFNYADYVKTNQERQSKPSGFNAVRPGYFKLRDDGDSCLVRFNVGSVDDLEFVSVHDTGKGQGYRKVSCLRPAGSYDHTVCPLCEANDAGNTAVGSTKQRLLLPCLVSYFDRTTNSYGPAEPAVWDRPASFARDIANLLRDYGDLRKHVLKVTRNGAAGSRDTTYTSAYIPTYDNTQVVPDDFSAFDSYDFSKHMYWEMTADEMRTYLKTGEMPGREKADTSTDSNIRTVPSYSQKNYVSHMGGPVPAVSYTPAPAPEPAPTEGVVEDPELETHNTYPTRNFTGFKF